MSKSQQIKEPRELLALRFVFCEFNLYKILDPAYPEEGLAAAVYDSV